MPSSTVENYLKQICLEQQQTPGERVAMGRLATAMNVVPGTATSMIKALADSGLVRYEPRGGVELTRSGERLALHVLRRHRLVEQFLVEVLKLDWSEVHDEAEELEHAISDKVLQKIDELLGFPETDPHGDPIPTAKGKMRSIPVKSLATCDQGDQVRISRVIDQNPQFLQFANQQGLTPGMDLTVRHRDTLGDSVTVRTQQGSDVTVGTSAAEKILVESR